MRRVLDMFRLSGEPVSCTPYGNGHINDTYRVAASGGGDYILQRISVNAFKDPASLMDNIRMVTDHLARGAKSRREVLTLIPTTGGGSYAEIDGDYWRVYEFVSNSVCFEKASPSLFAESARAFGRFFNQLSDFDATRLSHTIPNFHNTPKRVEALEAAIREDKLGRRARALPEIEAALSYKDFANTFMDLERAGELPLRVTHNDTKINNVLFDADSHEAVCVIDLDTVMPGHIMNDFGDSIRFGASTVAEDEPDYESARIDLTLYESYLNSYLLECGRSLTGAEIELLPAGAKMMTYECGVRFLADYLAGDVYFHISDPEQNLRRARTQFRLVRDMDDKWDQMRRLLDGAVKSCLAPR